MLDLLSDLLYVLGWIYHYGLLLFFALLVIFLIIFHGMEVIENIINKIKQKKEKV